MIPQTFIQELLARADIVEVVGRAVQLKKAGANYLGLCPFHGEKSPSFTVSPAKQFYHCFGCGVHGSAIGFLMEQQGLSYVEAIENLAQSLGMDVPRERADSPAQKAAPGLLQVLDIAAAFYRSRLRDAPQAIAYLKQRGLSGETAKKFGIGYAPEAWRGLEAAVADYEQEELVSAGLVIQGDADDANARKKRYDRFRDRVMFPIRNPRGQVIGFGGRVMGSGEPKYLNSPETPLFVKGRELYGLFEGRDAIRKANLVLVVEGYMDVVMLAQHGVGNAVATLGTATTELHIQKMLRLVDRVVFCFDGDKAGRKAAWRALEAALAQLADAKRFDFLFLPAEHDPDSFVREYGQEAFEQALAEALPLSTVLVEGLTQRTDLATPEGRAQLQALAKPLMQSIPPVAMRGQLLRQLAAIAQTDVRDFERYCELDKPAVVPTESLPDYDGAAWQEAPGQAEQWSYEEPAKPQKSAWSGGKFSGKTGGGKWSGKSQEKRIFGKQVPLSATQHAQQILAQHPALAAGVDAQLLPWLSTELQAWVERVAALPAGASFASLMESLENSDPAQARALIGRLDALDSELSIEEAGRELHGALTSLAEQAVRREIDAIVDRRFTEAQDRARYEELNILRRTIQARRML
jgi:DNA primase